MHPNGVANAAWVFAASPSKTPFYIAGALLAGWAVLLSVLGLSSADFPGSERGGRLVMLVSVVLVAATMTAAVVTAGEEGNAGAGTPAAAAVTLKLSADRSGKLAYDRTSATVPAGTVQVDFANPANLPHNVTIARGATVVGRTSTVTAARTTATVKLAPGSYAFYCSVDEHRQLGMRGTLTVR